MGFQLFLLFEKFLMALPKNWRKNFFLALAAIGYSISSKYRKIAQQNLDFIFGDTISQQEKKEISHYAFKNLALNFLHLMELRHMSKEQLSQQVSIENFETIQRVRKEGRPIIYVTSHYSSWELGGASIAAFIEPLIAVYKKMKNKSYEAWVLESRDRFGNTSMEKTNIVKPLIRNLKKGGACGILIDTNIHQREGVVINFMGKSLRQTSTPAYLARKFDAAIIPVAMRTDDDTHYTLQIFDEIPVEKSENEAEDILKATQLQADWLGSLIQKEPKFWFWLHRRFKGDYPKIYS